MNEHLDNAWKEFERTGEICNSAEQLLSLAGELTEQNKLLREALEEIVNLPEVRMDECSYVARKALEETN